MPAISRAFVKASIVYLILGAVLGALLYINRWIPLDPRILGLKSSHVQLVVVGWLTQFILGIAWWLFPTLKIGLRRDAPLPVRRGQQQRGSEPLFWATFICLNSGVALWAVFEPLYSWTQSRLYGFLAGSAGILMAAAAVSFVLNMRGRIRELGRK